MKNFIVKFSRLKLLLLLAFVCLTCAITIAEIGAGSAAETVVEPVAETAVEPAAEPNAEPAVEPTAEQPAEPEEAEFLPLKERMQKLISVEFRNTAIEDALMLMADQANVDIVKSPSVTGSVTVKLTNVPLKEALDNILAAHGYRYVADRNMIRVAPEDEIEKVAERMLHRIYTITYADVKEVESALKRFLSKQGYLSSCPSTSNIIVNDTEGQIKAMDEFVEKVDRMTPQILVEAKIYDISSTNRLDLGVQWQAGRATNYGTDGLTTIGGAAGALSTLTKNDVGFARDSSSTNAWTHNMTDPHVTGAFSGTVNKASGTDGLLRFGILTDNINIDALLRAEQENVSAKLLANPRILVLDNVEAKIKIIEKIPYQQLTQTSAGGSIGTTQFEEVGVELTVTPHLTRDDMIRLHIVPTFSVRLSDVVVIGSSTSTPQPVIAKREADTITLIKSGQTVVIGGLRKQDISQQKNKVPLLGDIPLLGNLFKFEGESTINSELVVFVTPYLMDEQQTLSATEKEQLKDTIFPTPKAPDTRLGKDEEG